LSSATEGARDTAAQKQAAALARHFEHVVDACIDTMLASGAPGAGGSSADAAKKLVAAGHDATGKEASPTQQHQQPATTAAATARLQNGGADWRDVCDFLENNANLPLPPAVLASTRARLTAMFAPQPPPRSILKRKHEG
jgi:hypothetical protein